MGSTGLKTQILHRIRFELSFMPTFQPVHCLEKPASHHILTCMLALHFSSHVHLYACNGFGLHSSGVLVVSCPILSCNLLCFSALHLYLQELHWFWFA